jgi:hypothetical protein
MGHTNIFLKKQLSTTYEIDNDYSLVAEVRPHYYQQLVVPTQVWVGFLMGDRIRFLHFLGSKKIALGTPYCIKSIDVHSVKAAGHNFEIEATLNLC